jgi:RND family efflux transporter MFP subunit
MRLALLIPLAIAACSSREAAEPGPRKGVRPAAPVEVATARKGSLSAQTSYLGNTKSALTTPLAAAAAGTVDEVKVRAGDSVARGDLLIQLDPRVARADLQAAEAVVQRTAAELEQAKRQLERIARSKAALSAPEKENFALQVATKQAQLASDQAAAQRARVMLGKHRVTAPFDGVIKDRLVNPGGWVNIGDNVLELVSTADLEVLVDVPYEAGRAVQTGTRASIVAAGQAAEAVVAGVVPALDESTRAMRVRVVTAGEPPPWLVPGMAVDVRLDVTISGNGVLVPRDAVVQGPVKSRVVKVADGVGQPISVEILGKSKDELLVRGDGLKAGDTVMTRGNERYRPGTPVNAEK